MLPLTKSLTNDLITKRGYCTEIKVNPKNWKQVSASTRKDWFIWYRFYDPTVTANGKMKAKQVQIKGMNEFKRPADRK